MPELTYWDRHWLRHPRLHRQRPAVRHELVPGAQKRSALSGDAFWHRPVVRLPVCPLA